VTQVELVDKSSINQQNISNYETGFKSPTLESDIKIADTLGVTLDELVIIKKVYEVVGKKKLSKTYV
jgi:transcriptional regulator with XRE-family HTH domain